MFASDLINHSDYFADLESKAPKYARSASSASTISPDCQTLPCARNAAPVSPIYGHRTAVIFVGPDPESLWPSRYRQPRRCSWVGVRRLCGNHSGRLQNGVRVPTLRCYQISTTSLGPGGSSFGCCCLLNSARGKPKCGSYLRSGSVELSVFSSQMPPLYPTSGADETTSCRGKVESRTHHSSWPLIFPSWGSESDYFSRQLVSHFARGHIELTRKYLHTGCHACYLEQA
jgi:hypothetical protein